MEEKNRILQSIRRSGQINLIRRKIIMAGTSDKNSYGNEMNHAGNAKNSVKSKNETDCRSKAKNKTSQSYSSEEDRY